MTKQHEAKVYSAPEMTEYGTLQQVVLNMCGTGSGDRTTDDGGVDSAWVAAEELAY